MTKTFEQVAHWLFENRERLSTVQCQANIGRKEAVEFEEVIWNEKLATETVLADRGSAPSEDLTALRNRHVARVTGES